MIYLASPYSHPDALIREHRFRAVCQATAGLLRSGLLAFSPVAHSHPLVEHGLPTGWDFWQHFDQALLERCDEIVVLTLPGWEVSAGVQAEIELARLLGKPVRYLAPGTPTFGHVAPGTPAKRTVE